MMTERVFVPAFPGDEPCPHCPPEPKATAAEIRQAVAFGKQAVIRELADEMAKETRMFSGPYLDGYRRAIEFVKAHRIEGEPRR